MTKEKINTVTAEKIAAIALSSGHIRNRVWFILNEIDDALGLYGDNSLRAQNSEYVLSEWQEGFSRCSKIWRKNS